MKRTNKCKKNAVLTLLRDEEWSKWTDSEIARRCAVHQTTVMRHRHEISLMQSIGEPGLPRIYVNRHGAISIMNTAAIGAPPAAPVASPAPKPEPPQTESVITAARSPEARPSVSPPTPLPSAKAASRDVEASDGLAEMTVAEINEQRRQEEAERANRLYDLPMSDADGPRFDEPVMDRFTAEIPDDLAVNLKDG